MIETVINLETCTNYSKSNNLKVGLECPKENTFLTHEKCFEPVYDLQNTLGTKKLKSKDLSDKNAVDKLENVNTILGDLYGSLNLPKNVKFALNLYGELFIPFHSLLNAISVHSGCGQKIDISEEENKLITKKVNELNRIASNLDEDLSDPEKQGKINKIREWVESLDTLKDQNNQKISNDTKIQILVGVVNGTGQIGKAAILLTNSATQLVSNPMVLKSLNDFSYATLTKFLIPSAVMTTMGIGVKSFQDVCTTEQTRNTLKSADLPKDIDLEVNKRLSHITRINTVNLVTNLIYGILAVKSVSLVYGFHYVILGLATLIGVGNETGKVTSPKRTLSMKKHENLRNNKFLLDFFRYVNKDHQNIYNCFNYYPKQPVKIPVMYALSSTKNTINLINKQTEYLKNEILEIKNMLKSGDDNDFSKILKELLKSNTQLFRDLQKERQAAILEYQDFDKLMSGLFPKKVSAQSDKDLAEGFSTIVNYMRKNGLEENILNNMKPKILQNFMKKNDPSDKEITIKYQDIVNKLNTTPDGKIHARNFIQEYLKATTLSMKKDWLQPKKVLKDEVLDLVIARYTLNSKGIEKNQN